MNFNRENKGDYYLCDTSLENIFINEYMPNADGVFVKVYIFALMYADHDARMTNEIIAKHLKISILDVLQAWDYWEKQGIIRKKSKSANDQFNYTVEFLSLKELVYSKSKKSKKSSDSIPKEHKDLLENDDIKKMYSDVEQITGRFLEGTEHQEILSWIIDFDVAPELVIKAYTYCVQKRTNGKAKYVASVIKEWVNQGLKTAAEADELLEETDSRHFLYRRILKALGLFRHPTEEEKRIMDTWFDELNFPIDTVLEACKKTSGITNPNLNYINSVLKGWKTEGKIKDSQAKTPKTSLINTLIKSYDDLREKNEHESEKRRAEIYQKVPRIKQIDEEIRDLSFEISRLMLTRASNIQSESARLRSKALKLNEEKAYLLTESNYRPNYLDPIYDCELCKDTGQLDDGQRCQCFIIKLEG